MSAKRPYITLRIPKSASPLTLERLATKLRAFKLLALQTSPSAFSAEYDNEVRLPLSAWATRITQAGASVVICIKSPPDMSTRESQSIVPNDERAELGLLLHSPWIGMFTMIGPVPYSVYYFPSSGQRAPGLDTEEIRWQLTGLFVLPTYRGQGLAKLITLAAINYGSDTEKTARFRLIVHPKNIAVVDMYKKIGFTDSARMTLAEAFVANGDEDMIPKDAVGEKWHGRYGMAMEYVV